MSTNSPAGWSETDSQLYQEIAQIVVPARAEQIAGLLTLLPFNPNEPFRVVELAAGQGFLSSALLTCFPQAQVLALDGSPAMRAATQQKLHSFTARASVAAFDIASLDWLPCLAEADAVLSSLCVHHLKGPEKQQLFAAICERLSARGTLLIADLVEPQRAEARNLFAATWDQITKTQSLAESGSTALYEKFVTSEWNYYRFNDPDDHPSSLFEQLVWLKEAGFQGVDCFWLQAGHAIYGGYKATIDNNEARLSFEVALQAA